MKRVTFKPGDLEQCAAFAYFDVVAARARFPEYDVEMIDRFETQVLVVRSDDYLVFAFRGTEAHKLKDILTDINILRTPTDWGKVHTGFHRALEHAWPQIWYHVQRAAGRRILITGHSMGGDLAVLLAARLVRNKVRPSRVVTFGMARVGSPEFAEKYNAELGNITDRVVVKSDPIALVPLPFRFRHVGRLHWWTGKRWRNKTNWLRWSIVTARVGAKWLWAIVRKRKWSTPLFRHHGMINSYIKTLEETGTTF